MTDNLLSGAAQAIHKYYDMHWYCCSSCSLFILLFVCSLLFSYLFFGQSLSFSPEVLPEGLLEDTTSISTWRLM